MAFVSQLGRNIRPIFFSIRKSNYDERSYFGRLSLHSGLQSKNIDLQIDESSRMFRIKSIDVGISVCQKGSCYIPKRIRNIMGMGKFEITLSDDGWFYGKY